MTDQTAFAARFEEHRPRLRAAAYRMLGTFAETDDAVQETWLRASRAHTEAVEDLGAWLTTILGRVCLTLLRARRAHGEVPLEPRVPDPVVERPDADPEREAVLADEIGLAMLVALETLTPDERVALVLHDAFGVPFEEVAEVAEATPAAVRQQASRARRKVRAAPVPDSDPARQREAVEAFYAAARGGDFEALLALLHPEAVLHGDGGPARPSATAILRGAHAIAAGAVLFSSLAPHRAPALVNGAPGAVVALDGAVVSVMAFTVREGRIAEIDVLADPDRLRALGLAEEWAA